MAKINRTYRAGPESLNELMKQGGRQKTGKKSRIATKKSTPLSFACKKNQCSVCCALHCQHECHPK